MLSPTLPVTALAPMQDVTDLHLMRTIASYGCPDYFFTEYLRVHETSRLDRHIIDMLSLHGRTVKDMYHGEVRYDRIADAVARLRCPVLAKQL